MAISDVLSEASADIKQYLDGDLYRDVKLRAAIVAVVEEMDRVRVLLDTVPATPH